MELYQKFETDRYDIDSANLECKGALIVLTERNWIDGRMFSSSATYIFNSGKDLHDYLVYYKIPFLKKEAVIDEFDLEVLDYIVEDTLTDPGGFCLHFNWGCGLGIHGVLFVDYVRVLTGKQE